GIKVIKDDSAIYNFLKEVGISDIRMTCHLSDDRSNNTIVFTSYNHLSILQKNIHRWPGILEIVAVRTGDPYMFHSIEVICYDEIEYQSMFTKYQERFADISLETSVVNSGYNIIDGEEERL
ncbi:unnamed protein product, partial [Adineta ricciae]